MRLPKSTKSRVWAAVAAVGALAVIIFGITAYNLWQDGNGSTASGSKSGSTSVPIPPAPNSFPTFQGTPTAGGAGVAAIGNRLFGGQANPFGGTLRLGSVKRVTIRAVSDGPMYLGYNFRANIGGAAIKTGTFSLTRNILGPPPSAIIAIEVMRGATYVTCSIIVDGRQVKSATVRGEGEIVQCLG